MFFGDIYNRNISMENKKCGCCNLDFKPRREKQKYCSRICGQCEKKQIKIEVNCEFSGCANNFIKLPNSKKRFCSRLCQVEWQKFSQLGEKNGNFGNRKPGMFKHTDEAKKKIKEKVKDSWGKKERLGKHLIFFERHRLSNGSMDWHTKEFRENISLKNIERLIKESENERNGNHKRGFILNITTNENEFYHSSWEQKRMIELNKDEKVMFWTKKHKISIKYNFGGLKRNYLPDFLILYKDGKKVLEEIKGLILEEERIKAQIQETIKFCKENNLKYEMNFFLPKNQKKYKNITEWIEKLK